MLKEIEEIPVALERLASYYSGEEGTSRLKEIASHLPETRNVMFVGMGTSLFASMLGTYTFNKAGVLAGSYEAGELLHHQHPIIASNDLIFLISQSGKSIELLKLAEDFRGKATFVGITEDVKGPMCNACDIVLPMMAGDEQGPATKTYVNTLALSYLAATAMTGNRIAGAAAAICEVANMQRTLLSERETITSRIVELLPEPGFVNLIARGSSVASTYAGALILKETSKLFAEPITAAAFRHGPIETIQTPGHAAFVFATEAQTRDINVNLAEEMASHGSTVVLITDVQGASSDNLLRIVLPEAPNGLSPLLEIMPLEFVSMEYAADIFGLARKYRKGILTHSYDDGFCNPNQICPAAKEYPEVPIIMAHIGFSADRNNRTIQIDVAKKYDLPNVFLDTSSLNICFNGILELAVEQLGSSNILFGSDSLQHFPAAIAERVRCALIADEDKYNILHLNAKRLIERLLVQAG